MLLREEGSRGAGDPRPSCCTSSISASRRSTSKLRTGAGARRDGWRRRGRCRPKLPDRRCSRSCLTASTSPRDSRHRRATVPVPTVTTIGGIDAGRDQPGARSLRPCPCSVSCVVLVVVLGGRDRRADVRLGRSLTGPEPRKLRYAGTAIATRMPRMTMTTRSSIRVKPCSLARRFLILLITCSP